MIPLVEVTCSAEDMETLINLPSTPYFCTLNFQPGEHITIFGKVKKEAERLNIVFKCDEKSTSNIGLFLAIDFKIDEVIVTSKHSNGWGRINKHYGLCFNQLPDLEVSIQCTHDIYKVIINGTEIEEYVHEIPWYNVTHMAVCGEIDIKRITYLPAKQLMRTGETPPPDYETATRGDYGSVNIPIVFKKDGEVLNICQTFTPSVPVRSEIRESSENGQMSSNYTPLRTNDTNNDIQTKERNMFILGTFIMTLVLFVIFYFFKKSFY